MTRDDLRARITDALAEGGSLSETTDAILAVVDELVRGDPPQPFCYDVWLSAELGRSYHQRAARERLSAAQARSSGRL